MSFLKMAIIVHLILMLAVYHFNCNAVDAVATTKLTNVQCESLDQNRVLFVLCRLKLIKRGLPALNITATLVTPVTNAMINVGLYKKASGYKPFLFNYTVDICKLLTNDVQNMPARILWQFITPYSNLNHSCPYKNDIFVKNLIISEDKFRLLPLPTGEYMLKLIFVVDNASKAIVTTYIARTE